jgi:hypothetical protein
MRSRLLLFALTVLATSCAPAAETAEVQYTPEELAVLESVQKFFDTMTARDSEGARTVLDPEGDFVSVRWDENGERIVRRSSLGDYIESLSSMTQTIVERYWDAEVRIQAPIATVWTPYDLYVDGEFSHCGIDAVQLLESDGRWVITGGTYTVETEGCPESPLGPLEG